MFEIAQVDLSTWLEVWHVCNPANGSALSAVIQHSFDRTNNITINAVSFMGEIMKKLMYLCISNSVIKGFVKKN